MAKIDKHLLLVVGGILKDLTGTSAHRLYIPLGNGLRHILLEIKDDVPVTFCGKGSKRYSHAVTEPATHWNFNDILRLCRPCIHEILQHRPK